MSTNRRMPSLSGARYSPYSALLSPVQALCGLISQSSSSSSSAFPLGPPISLSDSLSESDRISEGKSDGISEVELELACDPDPNPEDNIKAEESASRSKQLLEDQICAPHGSEPPSSPKVESNDSMPPGDEFPMDNRTSAQNIPGVPEPIGPVEIPTPKSEKPESEKLPGAPAEPMAGAEEGQEIGAEAKEGGNAGQSGKDEDSVMNGSNNFNPEEDPLEDGEIGELALLEDGEIVDIDPEPFKYIVL
ncbi:hypothetical protein FRC11_004187 [Ceratobasidium sp. 423]|nr:hypothetical protein FRC11_004187 [Ceratobasidium sp. 423]